MWAFKKFLPILALLFTTTAHAGTIAVANFSADSSVTHLNSFKDTVVNVTNGNISGSAGTGATVNILADSVAEADMFDDANPRIRDSYLLGITVDTISGGTASSQGTFVKSGGVPATDNDLTSDVSAIIAFVNGYYISKAATAQTYAAGTTTYLWLTEAGAYVQNTNPNTNVSNSALLASVVTSGTAITTVTDLANRRLPGLLVSTQFRTGLYVSRDTAAIVTVFPGTIENNSLMLSKTITTSLGLGTAADWAGGSSLRATSTYGYVGMDTSGNLKLHTTAPTHSNYALSVTAGKKRYATWSSTTYRILGWFYMNVTGSGEINTYELGNIKEADVSNHNSRFSTTSLSTSSTTDFASDTESTVRFYSSGGPLTATYNASVGNSGLSYTITTVSIDSVGNAGNWSYGVGSSVGPGEFESTTSTMTNKTAAQGTHTINGYFKTSASTGYINVRTMVVEEQ